MTPRELHEAIARELEAVLAPVLALVVATRQRLEEAQRAPREVGPAEQEARLVALSCWLRELPARDRQELARLARAKPTKRRQP